MMLVLHVIDTISYYLANCNAMMQGNPFLPQSIPFSQQYDENLHMVCVIIASRECEVLLIEFAYANTLIAAKQLLFSHAPEITSTKFQRNTFLLESAASKLVEML